MLSLFREVFHVERQCWASVGSVPRGTPWPIGRLMSTVNRLLEASTRGWVFCHSNGGTTIGGLSGPVGPLKSSTCPPGRKKACSVWSTRGSTLTALIVKTSNASCRSGRAKSSSTRAVSTRASSRLSCLIASRRKADFLVFASTMVSWRLGNASFSGIAGEPPPEPTSISARAPTATCRAASRGSSSSRSIDSSGSASDVRLILRFHRLSKA